MRKNNSKTLFDRFGTIYKNFFINYSLIVSAPGGVIIGGAFSHQYGGIGMHMKIPLRNYFGITLREDVAGVKITNNIIYNFENDRFEFVENFNEIIPKVEFLLNEINTKLDKTFGCEVGFLSEIPRRQGLNNPGVNAANFASVFLLLTKETTMQELTDYYNSSSNKSLSTIIIKIFKKFHSLWIGPNNSGFGALACWPNSLSPIIYQSKNNTKVMPLDGMYKYPSNIEIPFDVVVIGTADRKDIDFSLNQYDQLPYSLRIEDEEIKVLQGNGFEIEDLNEKSQNNIILDKFKNAIDISSLAIVLFLGRCMKKPTLENQIHTLRAFNNNYNAINLINDNFSRKAKVASITQYFFNTKHSDLPYALTTSIANNIVILTIKEHFRPLFAELHQMISAEINFNVTIPYISWRDGFDMDGIVVEQWRETEHWNSKLQPEELIFENLKPFSKVVERYIINSKEKYDKKVTLLFNADDKRVVLGGEKISSKDLPTTQATIYLFEKLFASPNQQITNNALNQLSYFQDRNELQSKIISPLRNLIEDRLNKVLNLKINGTYDEFTISYYPSDLNIGIIKRLK